MSFKNTRIIGNHIVIRRKKEDEYEERSVVLKGLGVEVKIIGDPNEFPLDEIDLETQYDITIMKSKEVQKKMDNYVKEEKEDE